MLMSGAVSQIDFNRMIGIVERLEILVERGNSHPSLKSQVRELLEWRATTDETIDELLANGVKLRQLEDWKTAIVDREKWLVRLIAGAVILLILGALAVWLKIPK